MSRHYPIRLLGTGSYVPAGVRDNAYFTKYLDTSDEWIVSRTGIRERRVAAPDEAASDLGVHAARRALEDAGLSADDIDVLICATATGDHQFPATAAFIQNGIGAQSIPAFDVGAACAGFLYAAVVATGLLTSGLYRRALVIGTEALTRFGDDEDRGTVVLFGDAAGAAIFERSDDEKQSVLYCYIGCDGSRADYIVAPAGGSRLPASQTTVAERMHFLRMRGREVYKFAVAKMLELIDEALEQTGLSAEDLALVIPHQSNLRIIESAREKLGLPREKMVVNIDRYGNSSAASVIVGLDEARKSGAVRSGDIVLMLGIGAGLTWGSMVLRL
ncbi:MAG: ketoacyl-ACP synthase III [Planctomycetes bacterium]|nr:ketoacyl-ACP synthase III [Planctomycetota bacterium]